MIDVLGIGVAAVDEVVFVDHRPKDDEKMQVSARSTEFGGLTATALVAAARLGAKTCYAGSLGYDIHSRAVIDDLRKAGVRVPNGFRHPDASPVLATVVSNTSQGRRMILYSRPTMCGASNDIPERTICNSRVLLVDGWEMEGSIRAATIARQHSIPVVADLESDSSELFEDLLSTIDHLLLSREFASRITATRNPRQAVNKLWSTDRQAVVVTCGEDGCWFRSFASSKVMWLPAYSVKAIDTNGCGDVFHGAYAASLAFGASIGEATRFATVTAALSATERGTRAGLPTREDVDTRLKEWSVQPCLGDSGQTTSK